MKPRPHTIVAPARRLTPALALALCLLPADAGAIQRPSTLGSRPDRAGPERGELELHPGASAAPLRSARLHRWSAADANPQAYAALELELGRRGLARFDAHTGTLDLLIPDGLRVEGASASGLVAQDTCRAFLGRHLELLAPGAAPTDFVLVSDETSAGLRTVGFAQHHQGLPVLGGQLSCSFQADRLVVVRSQALPHVQLPQRPAQVEPARAQARARAWIADDFASGELGPVSITQAPSADGGASIIVPLVHPDGSIEYREAIELELVLDGTASAGVAVPHGRWRVWVEASDGAPLARRSLVRWADVQIRTWERSPVGPRINYPAAFMAVEIDGLGALTDANGEFPLGPHTSVHLSPVGPEQAVTSASSPDVFVDTSFAGNPSYLWDLGDDPEQDAQLSAFVYTHIVKDYIRAIDPEFAVVDLQTAVTVNIDDVCNAFAEDNTINFFLAGGGCENTALISDVIFHEYGHVAHILGMQPGVGLFDGGVSEGASDYLSATIVNDPKVGVGFFMTDEPLRELDPDGYEWSWPQDTGEVHAEGQIIGGTLWDLRTKLVDKYGYAAGVAKADEIWLGGIRRSVDTPSWYVEALVTNDDDGDLQNGTPDICEINEAFGVHGLYQPLGADLQLSEARQADGSLELTLSYELGFDPCPGVIEPRAVLRYRPRAGLGEPEPIPTQLDMSAVGEGLLRAQIPPQVEASVTQYQVEFDWGNGTVAARPDNRADPWYEVFNGEVTPIWCADFEAPAAGSDWELEGEWGFGAPEGGSGDPEAAYAGAGVAGIALTWPGLYAPNTLSRLSSPRVDVSGHAGVRLQYRRWLNVEDGYWDSAMIMINDQLAWHNRPSAFEEIATVHHRDREWRFHDVDLAPFVDDAGEVQIEFSLTTDGGLELGGWNLDELCIVAAAATPPPPSLPVDTGCGDGVLGVYEQCDDGNLQNDDGCSSGCLLELPEEPEEPEEPELGWDPGGRGCGCVVEDEPGRRGAIPFGLAALGLLLRRRRVLGLNQALRARLRPSYVFKGAFTKPPRCGGGASSTHPKRSPVGS